MSLYNKYRPTDFAQLSGNEDTLGPLQNMLSRQNPPHAYLLYGPTGTGKTTTARIIAAQLGSTKDNLREIDTADMRGIDTIRKIQQEMHYKPFGTANARVWIMDEIQSMTSDAQNALLKVLEDPPTHAYFILCTTEPKKLKPTVKNRCSQFEFKPLTDGDMNKLLRRTARSEGATLTQEVRDQIVQDSVGLPRDALQILEKVLNTAPEQRAEVAKQAAEQQNQSIELCRALINNKGWQTIKGILKGLDGQDPESIRHHVLAYCKAVVLNKRSKIAGLIMWHFKDPFFYTGFPGLVLACLSINEEGNG